MNREEYNKMFKVENKHWWFVAKRLYAWKFLELINSFFDSFDNILDIGCGTGRNLLMLKRIGKVYGVDSNPLALKFCLQRGEKNVKLGIAEKLPFSNNRFNLVTLFDVLYHQGIKSDLKALEEAYRVIKPGGFLLVNDCAHQWLYGPHDLAMQARQRYSRSELRTKIKAVGFKIIRASYTNMLIFPFFIIERLINKYFRLTKQSDVWLLPQWINNLLIKISRVESALLARVNLPIGSSVMILARKI
jgi:SAM-dependent methyltransferase